MLLKIKIEEANKKKYTLHSTRTSVTFSYHKNMYLTFDIFLTVIKTQVPQCPLSQELEIMLTFLCKVQHLKTDDHNHIFYGDSCGELPTFSLAPSVRALVPHIKPNHVSPPVSMWRSGQIIPLLVLTFHGPILGQDYHLSAASLSSGRVRFSCDSVCRQRRTCGKILSGLRSRGTYLCGNTHVIALERVDLY